MYKLVGSDGCRSAYSIEVNLYEQTLAAFVDDQMVYATSGSNIPTGV